MKFVDQPSVNTHPSGEISRRYLAGETELVEELIEMADAGSSLWPAVQVTAAELVRAVRKRSAREGGIDAFLQQYDLSSKEGVLLMCIAEALLRIPDADTADRLIADKVTSANWKDHLGASDSLFVNASTWGLMLTGEVLQLDTPVTRTPAQYLGKLASRAGEPVVRAAMRQAMRIMGHQFVMGRTIEEALARSRKKGLRDCRYSFDMLGESALTAGDATQYFDAYRDAIQKISAHIEDDRSIFSAPSISVKLSALCPRYSYTQYGRVMRELVPRLMQLCEAAKAGGIALTIDAEESHRLELSLDIFQQVYRDDALAGYEGFGMVVQSYQRRATDVVRYLVDLADGGGRRIPVRLVKGAYWDAEIKSAQEGGFESFPVFTRKVHTDVSYLACARLLFNAGENIYPQFATHNAHTIASVLHLAGSRQDFEFQRLHGMGEELYEEILNPDKYGRACRVYAPVGSHEELLPYLVRRLLENGSNTSFVNRIFDENIEVQDIVADPITLSRATACQPHPRIPAPSHLFGKERKNSRGVNLADRALLADLLGRMDLALVKPVSAGPIVSGKYLDGRARASRNPAKADEIVGTCEQADHAAVDQAMAAAIVGHVNWSLRPVNERADILIRAADLYQQHAAELLALCVREAGKTLEDALAELREAIDFLRYYALEARTKFAQPVDLPGPSGERNTLGIRGRGVFVCISPWNFPLAIFTGQVAAALVVGNAVLAKPAEQTPLVAFRATELLLEAGVPVDVLHFLPGDGEEIGGYAVAQADVAGVAFTGSNETAWIINQTLAARRGAIAVLVAETGGQNAMFVDSSALPEQVVLDVVQSAFNSAGQRCSALRLLCVQEDIASPVIELLQGHMQELVIGDPVDMATDVGPVIDEEACHQLQHHVDTLSASASVIHRCELPGATGQGYFFAPVALEIESVDSLAHEVFGPVLHVLRFPRNKLKETMDAVNRTGFGLTMGLHSRIDSRVQAFIAHSGAGNIYINRNMIGAVVGVQPFGGRGLSGTGPKAGGPNYLQRFTTEYTVSNNISAVGGDASLLALGDD